MKKAISIKMFAVISILLLIVSFAGVMLTPVSYDGIWITIMGVISLICVILNSVEDAEE